MLEQKPLTQFFAASKKAVLSKQEISYFQKLEQKLLSESDKITKFSFQSDFQHSDSRAGEPKDCKREENEEESTTPPLSGDNAHQFSPFLMKKRQTTNGNKSPFESLMLRRCLDRAHKMEGNLSHKPTGSTSILNPLNNYRASELQMRVVPNETKRYEHEKMKESISTTASDCLTQTRERLIKIKQIIERRVDWSSKPLSICDFTFLSYIERGQFGEVYIARHNPTQFICALKRISKTSIQEEYAREQIQRQIRIQSFLNHPNIVQLYSFFTDSEYLYLMMELCVSGNAFKILKQEGGFKEAQVKSIIKQVCHAVEFMHDNDIIHRDIKPENILFHDQLVKICDFGWSVNSPLLRNTRCGTPLYSSPEIVQQVQYDNKIDIWSIGILTYELFYVKVPFQIRSEMDLSKIILEDIYFPKKAEVSPLAKSFILSCLSKDPKDRHSISKLIDHSFIQNA